MYLKTIEGVEFRRLTSSKSKDGNNINYYYHFEDDENGAFQIFSRNDYSGQLVKGDLYSLTFKTRLWDNRIQFDLDNIDLWKK